MRNYGKISPFFWTRGSGKRLRGNPDAQVIALYLSTSPTANLTGLYYLPLATIVSETGLPLKRVMKALAAVKAAGYADFDEEAEIALVPNQAQFEIGGDMKPGDKRRGKVLAELAQVGNHPFAGRFQGLYATSFALGCPIEGASEGHPVDDAILGPLLSVSVPPPDPSPSPGESAHDDGSKPEEPPKLRLVGPPLARAKRELGTRRFEQGFHTTAFGDGVTAVTGTPYSVPRREVGDLDDAIDEHAPSGCVTVEWVRTSAEAFRRAIVGREKFHRQGGPGGWLEWLNNGAQNARQLATSPEEYAQELREQARLVSAEERRRARLEQERVEEQDAVEDLDARKAHALAALRALGS